MTDGGDGIQPQTPAQPTATPGDGRRCVIWVPPAHAAPSRLLAAMSRRHVPVTVLADAPSVMYDLGLPGPGVLALIVVEPADQPHLRELRAAVGTYYPRLPVWQYRSGPVAEGGGLARLDAVDTAGVPVSSAELVDRAPRGGLSQDGAASAASSRPVEPTTDEDLDEADERRALRLLNDEPREPMLTAEELEMLLGPISHEEPPRA